jgi:ABC-type hemin transport system substrate-binding protein
MTTRDVVGVLLGGLVCVMSTGCERSPDSPAIPVEAASEPFVPPVRVVSLSPAITRTLRDLGAEGWIVGRTPYCRGLGDGVPVVGDLLAIDPESIRQVDPDLVLVQPAHGGVQPAIESLATTDGFAVESFPIDSLEDLEGMIDALPRILLSKAGDVSMEQTRAMIVALASLRDAMRQATSPLPEEIASAARPIVVLFSIEPPMAFGEGTFVDGLLGRLGVRNAITSRGYPELSLEDLVRLDPRAVLLLRESEAGAAASLAEIDALPLGSAKGRVRLVIDDEALVPGSGWIGAAAKIRAAIESIAAGEPAASAEPSP